MLFLPKMAASFCNLVGLLQHNTRIFSALPLKNNLSFASWIRLKAWVILNIMTDWVTFYLSRISFCAMHKECVSHTLYEKSLNCRIKNLRVSSNVHYPPTCSCLSTEGKGAKSITDATALASAKFSRGWITFWAQLFPWTLSILKRHIFLDGAFGTWQGWGCSAVLHLLN